MSKNLLPELLFKRRSVREFSSAAIPKACLKKLIWASQGQTGSEGKRVCPSAHALYPLKLFASVGRVEGLETGFYAIDASSGSLELLENRNLQSALRAAALDDQPWLEEAALVLTIYADMAAVNLAFSEQVPLGRRGERYAYIEAGAVAQNLAMQALELGIGSVLVAGFNDVATASVHSIQLQPLLHVCFGFPLRPL
jgi:SagB-type dehydrogenase family enzyme